MVVRHCKGTLAVRGLGDNLRSEVSELLRLRRRFILFNFVSILHDEPSLSYGLGRQEWCGEGPAFCITVGSICMRVHAAS